MIIDDYTGISCNGFPSTRNAEVGSARNMARESIGAFLAPVDDGTIPDKWSIARRDPP